MLSSTPEIRSECHYDAVYGPVSVHISETPGLLSVEVETSRLKILSANTDEYEHELAKLYGSEKVNAFVGAGTTLRESAVHEKIQRWMNRWSEHNPLSGYVVVSKDTGEFVGQIILKPVKDRASTELAFLPGIIEIGFLSKEKHWGQGYGKEFTHAMVHHLVPQLIKNGYTVKGCPIDTIMATAREDNIASNRVLDKFLKFIELKPRYGGPRMWYKHNYTSLAPK